MSIAVTQIGRVITQNSGNILGPNGIISQQAGTILGPLFTQSRQINKLGNEDEIQKQIEQEQQQRNELHQGSQQISNFLNRISTPGLSFENKIDLAKQKIQDIKSKQLKSKENRDLDKQIKEKQKLIKQTQQEENKYQDIDQGAVIQQKINQELEQHKSDLEKLNQQKQQLNKKKEETKSIIDEFNNHLQDKKEMHLLDIKNKSKYNSKYDYDKIQDLVNKMNENHISGFEQDRILEDIQRNGLRDYWQYPRYDQRYKLLKPKDNEQQHIDNQQQIEENKQNEFQNGPNPINNHDELNIQQQQADNTNIQREIRQQDQNQIQINNNPDFPGNPYNPNNQLPNEDKNYKSQIVSGLIEIAKIIYDHNNNKQTADQQLNSQQDLQNFYTLQIQNILNNFSKQQQITINNIFNQIDTDQVHKIINLDPEDIMSQYIEYY